MSLQHQPISTSPDATQLPEALRVAMDLWTTKLNYNELLQSMQVNVTDTWKAQKDQSLQTRKVLAETTKQFKKSVKAAEQAAIQLSNDTTPNATTELIVTSIDTLSNECRSTVKLYQEEIDSLTRRCKNVEQEYSAVYAQLVDVPDPTVLFQHCNDIVGSQNQQMLQLLSTIESLNREWQQAEKLNAEYKLKNQELTQANSAKLSNEERDELISLRKEVTEYEVEFRSLKNQDITIRKLEEKIDQLQLEAEESIRTAVQAAKEEIVQAEAQQVAELLERENMLQVKIQTLELQLHSERTSYQLSQQNLSKVDDHMSNQQTIWDVQRNILMDDNTRVREQLQVMTRERDDLLNDIAVYRNIPVDGGSHGSSTFAAAAAENHHAGSHILRSPASMTDLSSNNRAVATGANGVVSFQDLLLERNAYEAEVSELTETNVILREALRQKEEVILREKRSLQSKVDALERERTSLQNNISTLETQLSSAPSRSAIESMKRELRLLKRLEYNAEENNDDIDKDRDPELTAGGSNSATASDESDLETILVNKLRHAEKELILERNLKNELSEKIETLQQQLLTTDQAKKECEQLIVSLEKDLQRAITQATPTITQSKHKVDVVPQLSEENASAALQHILDPSVPPPPASLVSTPSTTKVTSEKADDDHSVATIVMAQRDRLRVRCDALEAERDSFKRELQYQVQTLESLKSDNTKLYEKVRYLQNYNSNKGSTSVSGNSGGLNQRSVGLGGDRDLDLEALEQRYEASVDPFKQFSKSERQRKLNEMSPMERAVFVVAKTVLCTSSSLICIITIFCHYYLTSTLCFLTSSRTICPVQRRKK